jgi:hypothetical protein
MEFKTKYNIGDTLYYLELGEEIKMSKIKSIEVDTIKLETYGKEIGKYNVWYKSPTGLSFHEFYLYKTKQDLKNFILSEAMGIQ